jgi:methylated-DNA-protein-cysteine methyltransferase-like protein
MSRERVFRAMWRVVARIPRGRVATYGQIARMAGFPGGARTAGWALRALPDGLRITGRRVPWHRVINARGGVSPRSGEGHPDPGAARQILLLRRDGIPVGPDGTIDLGTRRWDGGSSRRRAPR